MFFFLVLLPTAGMLLLQLLHRMRRVKSEGRRRPGVGRYKMILLSDATF